MNQNHSFGNYCPYCGKAYQSRTWKAPHGCQASVSEANPHDLPMGLMVVTS